MILPATADDTVTDPDAALVPIQAPLAVQLLALADDQLSTEVWAVVIDAGASVMLTVGAGGGVLMVTEVLLVTPLQVSAYRAVPAAPAVTVCVPLVATVPLQASEAVQVVPAGLLTLQVSVTTWPTVVAVGVALMLTTGAGVLPAGVVPAGVVPVLVLVLPPDEPPPQALSTRHSNVATAVAAVADAPDRADLAGRPAVAQISDVSAGRAGSNTARARCSRLIMRNFLS
ncbi:hypothetical protein [Duganella sp. Leaf126]|uniref:hypothetical protein n=1 Tax=Duganella sp. Leaf126 TaxID=1736266 RepID=UPI001E466914|nr:hypothetical protein [Duganella sp. Leaf126]